jgi:Protein of unknown function (DUF3606)
VAGVAARYQYHSRRPLCGVRNIDSEQPLNAYSMFWRKIVPDDKTKTARDRRKIDLSQDYELRYWCAKFGVSEDKLHAAIERVGTNADEVARELGK